MIALQLQLLSRTNMQSRSYTNYLRSLPELVLRSTVVLERSTLNYKQID